MTVASQRRSAPAPHTALATLVASLVSLHTAPARAQAWQTRLVSPLSTESVSTRRPVFHWLLGVDTDGAEVQLCADRGCHRVSATWVATLNSTSPPSDLAPGTLYWRVRARTGHTPHGAWTAAWQLHVPRRSAPVFTRAPGAFDLDADGLADMLTVDVRHNAIDLHRGGAAGISAAPSSSFPAPPGAFVSGGSARGVGDLNGDGFVDVVVTSSDARTAMVYYGTATGLAAQPAVTLRSTDYQAQYFPSGIAGIGDIDGDGFGDLAIGDHGWQGMRGRIYVYKGGPNGVAATANATLTGPGDTYSLFGTQIAAAGDLNGDGFADIVVGAWGDRNQDGVVYIYLGSARGFPPQPSVALAGTDPRYERFGSAIGAGVDLNGDGFADLAIGASNAPYTQSEGPGRAFVFYGSAQGVSVTPSATLRPEAGDALFGSGLATGDFDGDGFGDVIVGANSGTGVVRVFRGGPSGVAPVVFASLPGTSPGGQFGSPIFSVGDTNGDGRDDFVIGGGCVEIRVGDGSCDRARAARLPIFFGAPGVLVTIAPAHP